LSDVINVTPYDKPVFGIGEMSMRRWLTAHYQCRHLGVFILKIPWAVVWLTECRNETIFENNT